MATPANETPGGSPKGETTLLEPDRAERALGRRAAEVRATIPHLEMSVDADASRLLRGAQEQDCSTTALLLAACAAALREFPRSNAAYRDGRFELYSRVNIGVTLPVRGTPPVATIFDADARSPVAIDEELRRLRARAEAGELTPPEQAGATSTFTDVGEFGIHRMAPLLTPPQAAAVAAGALREVVVLRDGAPARGHTLTLTLTCDHRILFAAEAGRFLAAIAGHVEQRR